MIVVIPEDTSELIVKPLANFGLAVSGDVGGRCAGGEGRT